MDGFPLYPPRDIEDRKDKMEQARSSRITSVGLGLFFTILIASL